MIGKGFAPNSLVTLYDGTLKPIDRIQKGDKVLTASGTTTEVVGNNKYMFVGQTKILKATGNPQPLECNLFQTLYSLNGGSWRASCNKWLFPSTGTHGLSAVNTLGFRNEVRLYPKIALEIESGDRLARVIYTSKKDGFDLQSDVIYLLGLYAAKGIVDGEVISLRFRQSDVYSMERVSGLVDNWGISCKIKSDNETVNYIISCDWLARWIRSCVLENGADRSLNSQILSMGNDKQIEFLSGYFGENPELRRAERSVKLTMQTQMMLDRNRIHATAHKGYRVKSKEGLLKNNTYNIRVNPFYAQQLTSISEIKEKIETGKKKHNFCYFIGDKVIIPAGRMLLSDYNDYLYYLELEDGNSYIVNSLAVSD